MHWYYGPMGWSGWAMLIVLIAIVVAAIVAGVVLTHRTRNAQPPVTQSPEDILATRFARGEIDEEEYRRRREALSAGK